MALKKKVHALSNVAVDFLCVDNLNWVGPQTQRRNGWMEFNDHF